MRIVVLDANYPHDENLYGDVFVHVRVKGYLARGHDVRVISFFTSRRDYVHEGVAVRCASDLESLRALIREAKPDLVAVHFFQGWMLRKLFLDAGVPIVTWVHGLEALGWYRRLFNLSLSREFLHYVVFNTVQLARLRKLIRYSKSHPGRVRFVFVSEWMRRTAERDTLMRVPAYSVIPNPIDTRAFPYVEKPADQRHRVLLIRSFDSRKYANDIAVDSIMRLSRASEFAAFRFSIHGSGRMFERLTRPLRQFSNVTVREGFLRHHEIASLHADHGVFLCPTRQDAQGVSMCEAMSSGLVPVSSRSSAIPEFVSDGESGILTDGSRGIADALMRLHRQPGLFSRMSRNAAAEVRAKSDIDMVIDEELRLISAAVEEYR